MVTASAAQKRRVSAAKRNDNNVNHRGLVPDPAADRRQGKLPVGPFLMGFVMFVVFGSCECLSDSFQTFLRLFSDFSNHPNLLRTTACRDHENGASCETMYSHIYLCLLACSHTALIQVINAATKSK